MQLHLFKDSTQLTKDLAEWICNEIENVLKTQESFSLLLSGGETPKPLYQLLASEPYRSRINWQKLQIFWGDERMVPFDDERNNAGNACKILIDKVDIPSDRVHIIRTNIEPNFAVDAYRTLLRQFFDNTTHSFDLALLGVGADGHTLSLFPGSAILKKTRYWVNAVYIPDQSMYRVTLMPELVNQSSKIVFIAEGKSKASAIKSILEGEYEPDKFPAQLIKPQSGDLHWFMDNEASKDLSVKI